MSALHLSDVPDELVRRLERLAERERCTPGEAAVRVLDRAVPHDEMTELERARAVLDWIRSNRVTPAPGTPDSTDLLREDRQR
jgi:hypothetical protein